MNADAAAAARRPVRWAPLTAAAVIVAAVIGLSVAIGGSLGAPHSAGPVWLDHPGPGASVPLRTAPAFSGGTVPAYYVVVNGRSAQVLATANGAVLATIRTPTQSAGYFENVSGAADDRTFVLAAVRHLRTELYLLRLDPQAGAARLSPLPVTVATGSALQFAGLALSPDGIKLAVAVNDWAGATTPTTGARQAANCDCGPRVWVYDLATGSRREWVWPRVAFMTSAAAKGQASLSWAASDKTLAFDISAFTGVTTTVRLLDTTAPGMNLSKSRVVSLYVPAPELPVSIESPLITADGATIVLGRSQRGAGPGGSVPETLSVYDYSARTGQPLAISYQRHYVVPPSESGNLGPPPSILWANPAGTVLIISTGAEVSQESPEVGVLRRGTFTLLPSQGTDSAGTVAQAYTSPGTVAW
jgi:hypothetical protein